MSAPHRLSDREAAELDRLREENRRLREENETIIRWLILDAGEGSGLDRYAVRERNGWTRTYPTRAEAERALRAMMGIGEDDSVK
jgi:hypothetical protein